MLWEHSVARSRCSLSKAWLQICWIKSEVEQNQEKRVKKKIFFLRPRFPQLLYRLRGRRFAFLLITSARLHKRCQAIHRDTHTHVTSSCHPPVCSCCDRGCWLSVVYVCVCVCVLDSSICVFSPVGSHLADGAERGEMPVSSEPSDSLWRHLLWSSGVCACACVSCLSVVCFFFMFMYFYASFRCSLALSALCNLGCLPVLCVGGVWGGAATRLPTTQTPPELLATVSLVLAGSLRHQSARWLEG